MPDTIRTRQAIATATEAAGLATGLCMSRHPELQQLPEGIRDRLVVQVAVTYLLSTGLLVPGETLDTGTTLAMGLDEPYASDVAASVAAAASAHQRILGRLHSPGGFVRTYPGGEGGAGGRGGVGRGGTGPGGGPVCGACGASGGGGHGGGCPNAGTR